MRHAYTRPTIANRCYLGCTLAVAVAETVPRDEHQLTAAFTRTVRSGRNARARFEGEDLPLLP